MEQPDIEKEVKRLFRADSEAISVKWELITEDDLKGGAEKGDIAGGAGGSGPYNRTDTGASLDIGKQSITLVVEPECIRTDTGASLDVGKQSITLVGEPECIRTDTGASLDKGKQSITLVGEPECMNQTIHYLPILNLCNNYHLHRAVFSSLFKYLLYKLVNYW